MIWQIEYTDTFGREANYSWVKRYWTPRNLNDREIVFQAKKLLGLTGWKCDREDHQGMIALRPRGMATVVFITYDPLTSGSGTQF